MKVYLAGPYQQGRHIRSLARYFTGHGHEVVSTWHTSERYEERSKQKHTHYMADTDKTARSRKRHDVTKDFLEIESCDAFVLFTGYEHQGSMLSFRQPGSGCHVEYGFALGRNKVIALAGPSSNIFHSLGNSPFKSASSVSLYLQLLEKEKPEKWIEQSGSGWFDQGDVKYQPNREPKVTMGEEAKQAIQGDSVNHPSHYTKGTIECIDVLQSLGIGEDFCRGNAIKYLYRMYDKGSAVQDAMKARWYVDRLISILENRSDSDEIEV